MSYRTSQHEMQMSLVECVVEAPSDPVSSTATMSSSNSSSSSSVSDDVSVSSTFTESDGDTPVIVVSHSSSSSSSPASVRRENQSRRQPSYQSSLSHAHRTRPVTGTYQQSTASKISPQNYKINSNVDPRRDPSPMIEITVDCDERSYGHGNSSQKYLQQGRRRTNNHRSAAVTTPDSFHTWRTRDDSSLAQKCRDDERLAEKYNELRQLLLNRLNLQTLTPQIRRQARQLIQRYYQGSSSASPGKYPGKYRHTMTLGTPSSERQSRATRSADRKMTRGRDRQLLDARSRTATWNNDAPLHRKHGEVSRDRKTVTFLDDYTHHDSHHDVEQPSAEDGDTVTSQYQHQQQLTTEANGQYSSGDDNSYSSNFSSESTSDDEPRQPQPQISTTQRPSQLASSSDRRGKKKEPSDAAGGNTQQRGRVHSAGTKKTVTMTLNFSCAEKPLKTTTKAPQKRRSPTRSRTSRKQETNTKEKHDATGDQNASPNRPRSGARRQKRREQPISGHDGHSGAQPEKNSDKSDEDGDKKSSRSSSSSSQSKSRSPSRGQKSHSPIRVSETLCEYHLKYTNNVDIRQWLKSKNSELRRQKKQKRRLERDRRRGLQEQQQAKEERRRESEAVVQRWMEEKRLESKMMSRNQKQKTRTVEQPQPDSKTSTDQDGLKNPNTQQEQNATVSKPPRGQDGKKPFVVKDGSKSKVSLEKCSTFPGVETWKTSGKKTSKVAERRKAYGDWLRKNRTGEITTGDEGTSAFIVDDHEDQTKCSPYQSDLHVQGSDNDRRCSSATTGRRNKGGSLTGDLRSQGRRPWSSKMNRIGTRLEPQGSDRFDLDPETLRIGTSQSGMDMMENTSPDLEIRDLTTLEKDSSSYIVPHVSFEFGAERTPSSDQNVISQVEYVDNSMSEDGKNTSEASACGQLDGNMRSSRDLVNIKSSDTKHLPVSSDTTSARSNDLENAEYSSVRCETPEDYQVEKKGHSGEDGERKTLNVESVRRSSGCSVSTNDDDDDVIVGGT